MSTRKEVKLAFMSGVKSGDAARSSILSKISRAIRRGKQPPVKVELPDKLEPNDPWFHRE